MNLYLSTNALILGSVTLDGSAGAWFIGRAQFAGGQPVGAVQPFTLPRLLAPVPHAGDSSAAAVPQFRGLRLAKGLALWAAVESTSVVPNAPEIAVQGGYY